MFHLGFAALAYMLQPGSKDPQTITSKTNFGFSRIALSADFRFSVHRYGLNTVNYAFYVHYNLI